MSGEQQIQVSPDGEGWADIAARCEPVNKVEYRYTHFGDDLQFPLRGFIEFHEPAIVIDSTARKVEE